MKRAFTAWIWSLEVVARSYWTVVVLAALMALWVLAAYEWLGLAESSALLLVLALVWALAQTIAGIIVVGGTVAGAAEVAATAGTNFPALFVWTKGRKQIGTTLLYCLASSFVIWICSTVFDWVNDHSVEVASFLTFHSQKPFSHILLEEIYTVIEWLLWQYLPGSCKFVHCGPPRWMAAGRSADLENPRRLRLWDSLPDDPAECSGVRGTGLRVGQLAPHGPPGILGLFADDCEVFVCPPTAFRRSVFWFARARPLANAEDEYVGASSAPCWPSYPFIFRPNRLPTFTFTRHRVLLGTRRSC